MPTAVRFNASQVCWTLGLLLVFANGARGRAGEIVAPGLEPSSASADGTDVIPREALELPPAGGRGRALLKPDPIGARIIAGVWVAPKAGDSEALPDGSARQWRAIRATDDGTFSVKGGYVYIPVHVETPRIMMLHAVGHGRVEVNGEPRVGDPYGHGYVHLPVRLRAGTNDLLFEGARGGSLRVALVAPKAGAALDPSDTTLPDLVVGQGSPAWGAIVVVNATDKTLEGTAIRARFAGTSVTTPVPPIVPLGTRKVAFRLEGRAPDAEGKCEALLELVRNENDSAAPLDTAKLTLPVLQRTATHKRTFVSDIDGSVQYFAVVPARESKSSADSPRGKPGLILTLHGAGVEARGQAAVYSPKPWAHVVAPTNRRPYGFDWEDWGRLDALEVLALARSQLDTDPRRTYLTGHSMGGHGTWYLGATNPDLFAAIAPSAGWISMWTYAGARKAQAVSPLLEIFERAALTTDTMALASNYASLGVYVLHGDRDDNVPVEQARAMRKRLGEFHRDFAYFEQPGAGHWWGNECCDWPPLIDFLARHELPKPEDVRRVDFVTTNPGIASKSSWATIEAQSKPLCPSAVRLSCDPQRRRVSGTTENVARLALDLGHLTSGGPIEVELDGQTIGDLPQAGSQPRVWLARKGTSWTRADEPPASAKGPRRNGPFKDAFRNRFQLVYGTRGTGEENAWTLAKARSDAETFWYRGNGSVDVIPDTSFAAAAERDRGVILYGHSRSNSAWDALLAESPVQVGPGVVSIVGREVRGDDLACLFLRPRPGSDRACVAVVGGTGIKGMRLADRLPIFVSGVALPDCAVVGPESLLGHAEGPRVAGFFGNDWSVERGEFAWKP